VPEKLPIKLYATVMFHDRPLPYPAPTSGMGYRRLCPVLDCERPLGNSGGTGIVG
jgi:hypothetical protein